MGGGWPGSAGTIRNLASAAQKRAGDPDTGAGVQGYDLTRAALGEMIEQLADRPAAQARLRPGDQARPRRRDPRGRGRPRRRRWSTADSMPSRSPRPDCARGSSSSACSQDRDPPLLEDVRRESVDQPGPPLPHRRRARRPRRAGSRCRCSTPSADAGLHELGDWGARAALGRLHAPRHRRRRSTTTIIITTRTT